MSTDEIGAQKKPTATAGFFMIWCRGTESNCRHGDF